jgi:hypothetical protein
MTYTTKIIQLSLEQCLLHYKVIDSQTLCGIKLKDKQTVLKYTLDEKKLCRECKEISPIPRIKDWCPRYQIRSGDHAKSALSIMSLLFLALPEQFQIKWGFWECGNTGQSNLTNFLINPDPKIEDVVEDEKALKVNIVGGEGRVKSTISFDLIAEYMPLIKEDFMEQLGKN